MKKSAPYLALIAFILVADQVTKLLILRTLPAGSTRTVIPGLFNLSHVQNRGAIFGFFNNSGDPLIRGLLAAASLAALVLVGYYFFKVPAGEKLLKTTLAVILGGALGNQIDRLLRGFVVDFLDLHYRSFRWPSFNVADSCITIGGVLLIYIFFFRKGPP
jgi:signal peptidase II